MIALIASALLGLYVFLPGFLFDRLATPYTRLKKEQRGKLDEITAGSLVALIPFALTWLLSHHFRFFGHWPFPVNDAFPKLADYQTTFLAAYKEDYFVSNAPAVWAALERVARHQARFLSWDYAFLLAEIFIATKLTVNYGRWRDNWWYSRLFANWALRRVSETHVMLTDFSFPTPRNVQVDVMVTDGHLYDGDVGEHFVDRDGKLSGILLKNTRRFRFAALEEDRKQGKKVNPDDYWRKIPGPNFYIPADKIVTLNIRFEQEAADLHATLEKFVSEILGASLPEGKITIQAYTESTPGTDKDPGDGSPKDVTPNHE